MFGIKVFNTDADELTKSILDNISNKNIGVEMALYGDKNYHEDNIHILKSFPENKKILHLNHSNCSIIEFLKNGYFKPDIERQLYFAKITGTHKAVIHLLTENKEVDNTYKWLEHDPYLTAVAFYQTIEKFSELGLKLYLEKCYEDRNWFVKFFTQIEKQGQANKIGFTLDIGHVNVWQRASSQEWAQTLEYLKSINISMHAHLHINDGSFDMHTPLPFNKDLKYFDESAIQTIIKALINADPSGLLILEHTTKYIEDSFSWISENESLYY